MTWGATKKEVERSNFFKEVPKILKPLVEEWTREGYIVSFKVRDLILPANREPGELIHVQLETDDALLIPKARAALARYGHQVVIGNELHTRKYQVVFGPPANGKPAQAENEAELDPSKFSETWLRIDLAANPAKEIEEDIVAELVRRHQTWAADSS